MRALGFPLPAPERRPGPHAAKLLPQDPESLLREPLTAPLPILFGVAAREGSFPYTIWGGCSPTHRRCSTVRSLKQQSLVRNLVAGLGARSPQALDELLPRLLPADVLPGADTAAQLGLPGASRGLGPGPLSHDAALRLARLVRDEYSAGGPVANATDAFIDVSTVARRAATPRMRIAFFTITYHPLPVRPPQVPWVERS